MTAHAESAAEFNLTVSNLAQRLALHNLVVRTLRSEWGTFGSWILEVTTGAAEAQREAAIAECQKRDAAMIAEAQRDAGITYWNWQFAGPQVTQVVWDGRERELCISTTSTGLISRCDKWVEQERRQLESSDAALEFAEQYLVQHIVEA
jgi:hypothetical protein